MNEDAVILSYLYICYFIGFLEIILYNEEWKKNWGLFFFSPILVPLMCAITLFRIFISSETND
jgi:hypothetical protein